MKPRDLAILRPKNAATGGTLVRVLCPFEDEYSGKKYTRYKPLEGILKGTIMIGPGEGWELVGAN